MRLREKKAAKKRAAISKRTAAFRAREREWAREAKEKKIVKRLERAKAKADEQQQQLDDAILKKAAAEEEVKKAAKAAAEIEQRQQQKANATSRRTPIHPPIEIIRTRVVKRTTAPPMPVAENIGSVQYPEEDGAVGG